MRRCGSLLTNSNSFSVPNLPVATVEKTVSRGKGKHGSTTTGQEVVVVNQYYNTANMSYIGRIGVLNM